LEPQATVTLIEDAASGDPAAIGSIMETVYSELQQIARRQLSRAGRPQTLRTTDLVHEAYLKLAGSAHLNFENRAHFLAIAARAMRQLVLNHIEKGQAVKRGGDWNRITFTETLPVGGAESPTSLLDLETALQRLEATDERLSRVVEYRFYAGLSVEETAAVLGVSDRTVKRDWRIARAFLSVELSQGVS
jgi:RNA polymerase sigma factor (TIGR02999 family)